MSDAWKGCSLPPFAAEIQDGGVASALGFRAAGVRGGFKKRSDEFDCALVVADDLCPCAGVFTQNEFCAAPVLVSRSHLQGMPFGLVKAVLVNAGNANAATGRQGVDAARYAARLVSEELGCREDEVLLASTGTIGIPVAVASFERAVPLACKKVSKIGGHDAACAIMTTDTVAKECAVSYESAANGYEGRVFTIGGMAKGSGMIMPDMATMIAVLTTDAPLPPNAVYAALSEAASVSFNKVTVDSVTSTNDSCFLLASGQAVPKRGFKPFKEGSQAFGEFVSVLRAVCTRLARMIASDGEGATRLVTVHVRRAFNAADADRVARAIANSPLVKAAVFGHDANWGRIVASLGCSGAIFRREDVSVDVMGLAVCRCGEAVAFDEGEALSRFKYNEVPIEVDLGSGNAETTVWTCDLSPEYVEINGRYRS